MKTKPKFKDMKSMLKEFNESLRLLDADRPMDASLLKKEAKKAPTQALTESAPAPKTYVLAENAPLSRYSNSKSALSSFRVLAGLEEREISPWNPGILGETRSVRQLKEDFGMTEVKKDKK